MDILESVAFSSGLRTTRSARAWWCPSLNLAERLRRSHSVSGWWARRWAHGGHVKTQKGSARDGRILPSKDVR
jgi:hypothetical protein